MLIVIAVVLGLLALAFVLYPLYRPTASIHAQEAAALSVVDEPVPEKNDASVLAESAEREQAAKSAIQEVELDYQLGNIADADYQELRERYMRRALAAQVSRYEREQQIDVEIEEQLRKMKETQES